MTAPYQFFDALDPQSLAALTSDIAARGVLVPVELDEAGAILDGHHRAQIADELGIDYPTIVRHFDSESEKREHVLKINLLRRHLEAAEWGKAFRLLLAERGTGRGSGARNDLTSANVAEVADELGVPYRTAARRVELSETVETYPALADLPQSTAIAVGKALDDLPEPEREEKLADIAAGDKAVVTDLARHRKAKAAPAPVEPDPSSPAAFVAHDPAFAAIAARHEYNERLDKALDKVHTFFADFNPEEAAAAREETAVARTRAIGDIAQRWVSRFVAARGNGIRAIGGKEHA